MTDIPASPRTPTYDELFAFVRSIASRAIDGDIIDGEEIMADGNDKEIDALYSFVHEARDLLGTSGDDLPVNLPVPHVHVDEE
jgi:hypothetical protein